jgi:DNA-binding NtrC family response regulator
VKKILIVDDQLETTTLTTQIAQSLNYEVSYAMSVRSAISKFEKETFAAVVTDVNMGTQNGLSLLQYMYRFFNVPPPTLVHSGDSEFRDGEKKIKLEQHIKEYFGEFATFHLKNYDGIYVKNFLDSIQK